MKALLLSGVAVATLTTAALADNNTIYLNQQDTGSTATITQSGSGNKAGRSSTDQLTQSGTTSMSGGNTLDIQQTGDNGTVASATFYRDGIGYSDSTQRGTGNALTVRQGGTGNSFFVTQHGSHPSTLPTGNNSTPLDPSLVPATGWNTLIQSGTSNTATVQQGRNDDQMTNGVFNKTSSGDEKNAAFIIRQSGASSSINLVNSNGSNGVTYADQSATNSSISFAQNYKEQNAGQGFAGNYNYAEFRQSGDHNNLAPDQTGANLRMFLTQSGDHNLTLARQSAFESTSAKSTLTVNQSGSSSYVFAFQGYNVGQARPMSSDYQVSPPLSGNNLSGYYQNSPSLTMGSTLSVTQTASSSTVGFTQNGIGQIATLMQAGTSNGLYGQQEGSASTATLTQSGGMSNNMFLLQGTASSSDNRATLSQDGGMTNFIYLAQTGSGQRADVAQGVANGNISNNVQSGNGNVLNVKQNKI